mgnify:FL=1
MVVPAWTSTPGASLASQFTQAMSMVGLSTGRTLGEIEPSPWVQARKKSLTSTAIVGKNIVAACSSCQWQLEVGIRQGQVDGAYCAVGALAGS